MKIPCTEGRGRKAPPSEASKTSLIIRRQVDSAHRWDGEQTGRRIGAAVFTKLQSQRVTRHIIPVGDNICSEVTPRNARIVANTSPKLLGKI